MTRAATRGGPQVEHGSERATQFSLQDTEDEVTLLPCHLAAAFAPQSRPHLVERANTIRVCEHSPRAKKVEPIGDASSAIFAVLIEHDLLSSNNVSAV